MLEFLLSVAGRVFDLFGAAWNTVYWYLHSAVGALMTYVGNFQAPLADYSFNLKSALSWYKHTARNLLDDIGVFNYGKTRYVGVDSFGDIVDYRANKKPRITLLFTSWWNNLNTLFGLKWSHVTTLFNSPVSLLLYLFNQGAKIVQDYEQTDKPVVKVLTPRSGKLLYLTDKEPLARTTELHRLYPSIKTISEGKIFDTTLYLDKSRAKIAQHIEGSTHENILDIAGLHGTIAKIAKPDVADATIDLAGKKSRIDTLVEGSGYSNIVSFAKNPVAYIKEILINWIARLMIDSFLSWLETEE